MSTNDLVRNAAVFDPALNERLVSNLEARLVSQTHYRPEEIKRVTSRQSALFPSDFTIEEATYERLRVLCTLSQCGMNRGEIIRSHRPIVGPLIVAIKRIAWRMMRAQLENTFTGIQEFCSWMVHSHAKLIWEHQELKKEVEKLKGNTV